MHGHQTSTCEGMYDAHQLSNSVIDTMHQHVKAILLVIIIAIICWMGPWQHVPTCGDHK